MIDHSFILEISRDKKLTQDEINNIQDKIEEITNAYIVNIKHNYTYDLDKNKYITKGE